MVWTPLFPQDEEKFWGLDTSFPCVWRRVAVLYAIAIDISATDVDEDAGDLGLPFTALEDDEEWVGWIDWEAVEARTGGAGASGS